MNFWIGFLVGILSCPTVLFISLIVVYWIDEAIKNIKYGKKDR